MVRDRKMYVAPTPFALTDGTTGKPTLIVPNGAVGDARLVQVGNFARIEAERLVVGYKFDLKTNEIVAELVENPGKGVKHEFAAYRLKGAPLDGVTLKKMPVEVADEDEDAG
jgi:hypothetical protein